MESFVKHKGVVIPFDRTNIDTDLIIPKQFLKSIKRTGFGAHLFDQLRYVGEGEPGMDNSQRTINPDFVLNNPLYQNGTILLTRDNFGCGSSREHAPWALLDFGIRVIIAPSFADIFYSNCFKNGMLPLVLEADIVDTLFQQVRANPGLQLTVDLENQWIAPGDEKQITFEIDSFRKKTLLEGLDDIGLTLERVDLIKSYERKQQEITPWLFMDLNP